MPTLGGFIVAILILLAGFIIGVIWANRISKRQGTQQFLSRVSGSPDFDAMQQEALKKKENSEPTDFNAGSQSKKMN